MPASSLEVRKPPLWVSFWLAFSTIIVCWDASYCFLRPRSMPGGDLEWIWAPYNMVPYARIDYIYGLKALEDKNGYTNAQALMNLIEAVLNIEYLYLRHFSPRTSKLPPSTREYNYHGHAPLVGFATCMMTWSKTALYFIQEYFCGFCMVGHNTAHDLILYYILPNGVWIVMPVMVCIVLGKFMNKALNREMADQVAYIEYMDTQASKADKKNGKAE